MSTQVNHVLKPKPTANGYAEAERCPVCGGTWFVVCHKIFLGFPDGKTLVPDVSDEEHHADEGFACVKCGTVITQDSIGNLAIELGRK